MGRAETYDGPVELRKDLGSWLEGGGAGSSYNGSRLGLPERGPGSMAPLTRRVPALMIDWLAAMALSWAFFGGNEWATLGVFAVENIILVGTLGFTVGHRALGLRVRPLSQGRPIVGIVASGMRTLLLCLVLPAVVWDGDGRGLHDRGAGTVITRI